MTTAISEVELELMPPLDAAQEIRECHEQVMACARKTFEHAVRIGELLTGVKVGLKHGEYQKWIALNCPFSERTARNYVRVYQRRDILKTANVAVLTDAYGILAKVQTKTANEASDAVKKDKSAEISERLRDEIRDTVSTYLNRAWEDLKACSNIDWQHFRSGVRGWLQKKTNSHGINGRAHVKKTHEGDRMTPKFEEDVGPPKVTPLALDARTGQCVDRLDDKPSLRPVSPKRKRVWPPFRERFVGSLTVELGPLLTVIALGNEQGVELDTLINTVRAMTRSRNKSSRRRRAKRGSTSISITQ